MIVTTTNSNVPIAANVVIGTNIFSDVQEALKRRIQIIKGLNNINWHRKFEQIKKKN